MNEWPSQFKKKKCMRGNRFEETQPGHDIYVRADKSGSVLVGYAFSQIWDHHTATRNELLVLLK